MNKGITHRQCNAEGFCHCGTLFLVATPIGNLEDISLRALRILKEVDLVICEDTRRTAKMLNHYGITTPRRSHHEHNEAQTTPRLLRSLRSGKNIALVTDAGTPLISDPGYTLVAACHKEGISVIPIPGPSAVMAALTGSGLSSESFFFGGFLPERAGHRRKKLEELSPLQSTLILFEAPHRILASLKDMVEILGARQACLAREITKLHEEWLHGSLQEIREELIARDKIQGEITLVIERGEPSTKGTAWPASLSDHIQEVMQKTGISHKEALKFVARQRGITRNQAYRQLIEED